MRTLEEQLSCGLLDRTGKRVAVTAEGEVLLRRCKRVIFELEQAGRELDGLRRRGKSRIRVGEPHSPCHFLIPSVLREFRDCLPRYEPVIEAGDTTVLPDRLASREIEDGSLKVVNIEEPGIEREWGAFHSSKREPSLVEEASIGMCEMGFAEMPSTFTV